MNKIRSLFPNATANLGLNRNSASLEPELGFQLIIEISNSEDSNRKNKKKATPQLNVNLIAARHLPTTFGFKTVQGYVVKVKLFPGSTKYDSCIQTNSWPKFNENFKFSLEPDRKSSIKVNSSVKGLSDNSEINIETLFSGQFVVLTVFALLELPPGNFNRLNKTYQSLKDRSTSIVQRIAEQKSNSSSEKNSKSKESTNEADNKKQVEKESNEMTKTESKRNIGSVTCYLEPKIFKKNPKSINQYLTEELWYPIKDLTVSPIKVGTTASSVARANTIAATKGQLELALELYDTVLEESKSANGSEKSLKSPPNEAKSIQSTTKKPWITDIKRKLSVRKSKPNLKSYILKVTTTKFRCSIKVKDQLESAGNQIYIKTAIYDDDVPINSWKSNHFTPLLSTRWDPSNSTIEVPLPNLDCLKRMRIKSTIATKTKVGKKVVLGTVVLSASAKEDCLEHWNNVITSRNEQFLMWHNFE